MQSDWNDAAVELARAMLSLPSDHPAVAALSPEAGRALGWLRREERRDEARAKGGVDPRHFGISLKIDRAAIDRMVDSEPWRRVFPEGCP